MTHLKMLAATAALVGGLGLASAASAAPLAPIGAGTLAGTAHVTTVAMGCGPGFARGPLGRCRPIARGFRPGPPCFVRRTPVGPRRICR
ncbi:GCG_CRPN prefix-to-repeats domain-containing protein [Methylobacterium sp. C33D]